MKNINSLLKEELRKERKRYLTESVLTIKKSKTKEQAVENTVYTVSSLMKEGYSFDEISRVISEQESNIFTKFGDYFSKGFWGGAQSQIVEWLINWALGMAFPQMNPVIKKDIAIGLADIQLRDLFNMFTSADKCVPGAAHIVDTALEVGANHLLKQFGISNLVGDSFRNVIMDGVRESNIGETIATNILCKRIHGTKVSQNQTTPPQTAPIPSNQDGKAEASVSSQPSGSIAKQADQKVQTPQMTDHNV